MVTPEHLWFECPETERQFEYIEPAVKFTPNFRAWQECPGCGDCHVVERHGLELVEVETREDISKTLKDCDPAELGLREMV